LHRVFAWSPDCDTIFHWNDMEPASEFEPQIRRLPGLYARRRRNFWSRSSCVWNGCVYDEFQRWREMGLVHIVVDAYRNTCCSAKRLPIDRVGDGAITSGRFRARVSLGTLSSLQTVLSEEGHEHFLRSWFEPCTLDSILVCQVMFSEHGAGRVEQVSRNVRKRFR
jgi:hypothetical protein